jgi:hypothetical protein
MNWDYVAGVITLMGMAYWIGYYVGRSERR